MTFRAAIIIVLGILQLENSVHPMDGGDTIFPEGILHSLVNKVCGVQYSRGYRIHSDTGVAVYFIPPDFLSARIIFPRIFHL